MLGRERINTITDQLLARSTADQTEIVILGSDSALTRFARSSIHQNVSETDVEVRIRVVQGKRVGVATTNDLAPEALARTLETAQAIADLQPENPDFVGLPAAQPLTAADAFDEATAGCSPERRAHSVETVCRQAQAAGVEAAGALTTEIQELAVANSLGTLAYHVATRADFNTTVLSETSAGYAADLSKSIDALDFEALGREAVSKCLRGQNPRSIEPGRYTVILDPYATQDLVMMLAYTGLGALAVQEGRSFMAGRFGELIADPRISLWDDGLDPGGIPLPFDFEGVPKQRVEMIRAGQANAVVYDSYRAGREPGKQSTGHALPAPNALGPFPLNTFMAPGDSTLDEMIQSTERGLYVSYFHYTRPVEPRRVVITGMTRNGTFLVEDGEIKYPVKNLRFTQSYLEALNQVQAIGRDTQLLSAWNLVSMRVPAIKLGGFNFTGATEF